MKHTNTTFGQNAEVFYVKAGGAYNKNCTLKSSESHKEIIIREPKQIE
jgi:hypothetical protein